MGKQKQLMPVCSGDVMQEQRPKEMYKVTSEEAENSHNDINQWWTSRDWGSRAFSDYKALWQTATSNVLT